MFTSADAVLTRVTLGEPGFCRSRKKWSAPHGQSERPIAALYRPWSRWRDLLGAGRPLPALLQQAWLGRGGVRPWSAGSAVPRPGSAAAMTRRTRRGRHRGARAGRRVQQRRYRGDRNGERRCRGVTQPPPERVLATPARLTQRQTTQYRRDRRGPAAAKLKICHLNVCSLMSSIDDVNSLLVNERPDILCLTETWLSSAVDSSFLKFPEYDIVRRDRPHKSRGSGAARGGGLCVLYRDQLRVHRLEVPTGGSIL